MLEEYPSPPPPRKEGIQYVGLRILIVAGVGFLLAFGLCGVSAVTGSMRGSAAQSLAMGGVGLLLLSGLALIVGVITLVVELIARR